MQTIPKKFTVEVTVGAFDWEIYQDPATCYLARAIKAKFPDAIVGVDFISTKINHNNYVSIERMDARYCMARENSTFPITLVLKN